MARASAGRTMVTANPVTIITRSLIGAVETDSQLRALTAEANALGAPTPHAWTVNRKQAARRRRTWAVAAAILGSAVVAGAIAAVVIAQAGDRGVDPALEPGPALAAAAPAPAAPSPAPTTATPPATALAAPEVAPLAAAPLAEPPVAAPPIDEPPVAIAPDVVAPDAPPPAAPDVAAPARPTPPPASPRTRPSRAEPRAAAPSGDLGVVNVNAVPWAYVTVNGKRQLTPATLRLPPGSYTLSFENPELGAKTTRFVTVKAGDNRPVRVRFAP
jgi:hypothetical protein